MKKLPFTVLGFDADSRELRVHHVTAKNSFHAFAVVSKMEYDDGRNFELVTALPGHLKDGTDFALPGDGLVDNCTVLEQPDVFGRPGRIAAR